MRTVGSVVFFLLSMQLSTGALYSKKDKVTKLTESNFDDLVVNGDKMWLVEFYAPWCGHCQKLVPHYKAAAKELDNSDVAVGAVDCDTHKSLAQKYGVKGYPTIKFFGADKKRPIDYQVHKYIDCLDIQSCNKYQRALVRLMPWLPLLRRKVLTPPRRR